MGLVSFAIWVSCDLMLACLLFRAWRAKLFRKYPYFYGYVWAVAGSGLVRVYLQVGVSQWAWGLGYWITEFLSVIAGFGVTWQIYASILDPYRGVRRMGRALLGVFGALVIAKALVELAGNPVANLGPTTVELERNLRFVQTLLLLVITALAVHYRLPLGRNIRSMLAGYGLYLVCAVIALSLRSQLGGAFETARTLLQRLAYTTSLAVWCVGMWSYYRNPVFPDTWIDRDYNRISEETSRAFGRLREHVTQSWRP
jgi:hypothetical protein